MNVSTFVSVVYSISKAGNRPNREPGRLCAIVCAIKVKTTFGNGQGGITLARFSKRKSSSRFTMPISCKRARHNSLQTIQATMLEGAMKSAGFAANSP